VDDDAEILRLCHHSLAPLEHEVVAVQDPFELLRLLNDHSFDLILLDIQMPGYNGFELLQRLKKTFILPVPVMMLTAAGSKKSVRRCLELGAIDFLVKPFRPRDLAQRVQQLLEREKEKARPASGASPDFCLISDSGESPTGFRCFVGTEGETAMAQVVSLSETCFVIDYLADRALQVGERIKFRSPLIRRLGLPSDELVLQVFLTGPLAGPGSFNYRAHLSTISLNRETVRLLRRGIRDLLTRGKRIA
jgi:DNA-binding response OmpR family regulator